MNTMVNKTVLITGGNSGIGFAAALELARMGAHIVLMSRSRERGEKARMEIINQSGNRRIDLIQCDLASLESVRTFASEFLKNYSRLDVLINNAGIYTDTRMLTADGFEYQFGVNHLGHFLLTELLLDLLKKSAPSRIINVSSHAHFGGKTNFSDIHLQERYSGWKAYAQAKLANILFTYELAHRLAGTGVTANCLHPGVVSTRFAFDRSTEKPNSLMRLMKPFAITPEKGARTTIFLATSPDVETTTGKYFNRCKAVASSRSSYDLAAAEKLWNLSKVLTR
jgi:NAD(P)-dependent dehydrogenase (short-subunit alcohol dehydrogenase family)